MLVGKRERQVTWFGDKGSAGRISRPGAANKAITTINGDATDGKT
jgi:hypothetical protein